VLSPRQVHADRLRGRKREIHAYAPIRDFFLDRDSGLGRLVQFPNDSGPGRVVPGGEPLTRAWRLVVDDGDEVFLTNLGLQPQDAGSFTVPDTLLGQVVIAGR